MLVQEMIQEIRERLQRGEPQRDVARQLGVSRGTVHAIARGKHVTRLHDRCAEQVAFPSLTAPPRRCPGCGGMVQMPCLLCQIRAIKAEDHRRPSGS